MDRRQFLTAAAAGSLLSCTHATLRVAMLHLEPQLGELAKNSDLCEQAMATAAKAGAEWILTPELGLTGYHFDQTIGIEWIRHGPDQYVERLRQTAKGLAVTLFLGHVELGADGKRYNTAFVIGRDGAILGRHHKINVVPVAEEWSSKGIGATPVRVDSRSVGVLICADAWPPDHARKLAEQGAEILVSPATWPPEPHGPETAWEQRTIETGLPLMVCNRTGVEGDFDMRAGESVVVMGGKRLVRHVSEHSSILVVDWDFAAQNVVNQSTFQIA